MAYMVGNALMFMIPLQQTKETEKQYEHRDSIVLEATTKKRKCNILDRFPRCGVQTTALEWQRQGDACSRNLAKARS